LHHCVKIPDTNNLRGERFALAHCFRGFGPQSLLGFANPGPIVRQNIMVQERVVEEAAHFMGDRKQREEEGTRNQA
jgi:hypothetical protein